MSEPYDPRVYFAAERTLLAWFRTGLAVIGLGFVVARFGLFLRILRGSAATPSAVSSLIGVALVILGALAIAAACVQHTRFLRSLGAGDRPHAYWTGLSVLWGVLLALLGLALALYLALGSGGPGAPVLAS